jgi:glycosyltransferase involved in cell wall biosynthesis
MLHEAYQNRGYASCLAVGHKQTQRSNVLLIPDAPPPGGWAHLWFAMRSQLSPLVGTVRGVRLMHRWLRWIAQPSWWIETRRGFEDFNFPGTWQLLELTPEMPDVVHCHNLHGNYFDLTTLISLSRRVPVVLTLHDSWLLTGHCAHSFDCERWKTGCGQCPDLTIYPSVHRDSTHYNWQRKRGIYARSRLHIATPSQWLMNRVKQSILVPAIAEAKVIPNGVDLTVFLPGDQREARNALRIPEDRRVLLFVGNRTRSSVWRDYSLIEAAVRRVAERLTSERLLLICLGERADPQKIGSAEVWFISYQADTRIVSKYYQAADIYVHPARVETFSNAVVEAMACGIPVIATAVGGIPELVKSLKQESCRGTSEACRLDEATGFLVPPRDPDAMAVAISTVLIDERLRKRLGRNGTIRTRKHYSLERQVEDYLNWYREITERETVSRA